MSEAEPAEDTEAPIQTRDNETTGDVHEVDWAAVWAIAGAQPGELLSPTQASLCVQASDQTAHTTDESAREFVSKAREQGELKAIADVGPAELFVTGGSA